MRVYEWRGDAAGCAQIGDGDPPCWAPRGDAVDGAAPYDNFGRSVAIEGDTIVVGATQAGNGGPGVAYVLRASDGAQLAKLTAADGAAGDKFGGSVAISGDTIVVGAAGCEKSEGCASIPGAAYVFRTSDGWNTYTEIKLTAPDAAAYDGFGFSVAIDGDTIAVSYTHLTLPTKA